MAFNKMVSKKVLIISLIVLLSACKKEDDFTYHTGNQGNSYYSTVFGYVKLVDEYGNLKGNEEIKAGVKLEGNSLTDTTETDSAGFYKFNNVEDGRYVVSYFREGYGKAETVVDVSPSVQELPLLKMYQVSTNTVKSLSAVKLKNPVDGEMIQIEASVEKPLKLRLFAHHRPDVSDKEYLVTEQYDKKTEKIVVQIPVKELNKKGIQQGDTIYLKLHGDNGNEQYDSQAQKFYFPCISADFRKTSVVLN